MVSVKVTKHGAAQGVFAGRTSINPLTEETRILAGRAIVDPLAEVCSLQTIYLIIGIRLFFYSTLLNSFRETLFVSLIDRA